MLLFAGLRGTHTQEISSCFRGETLFSSSSQKSIVSPPLSQPVRPSARSSACPTDRWSQRTRVCTAATCHCFSLFFFGLHVRMVRQLFICVCAPSHNQTNKQTIDRKNMFISDVRGVLSSLSPGVGGRKEREGALQQQQQQHLA